MIRNIFIRITLIFTLFVNLLLYILIHWPNSASYRKAAPSASSLLDERKYIVAERIGIPRLTDIVVPLPPKGGQIATIVA
jgi:hypothetical protein